MTVLIDGATLSQLLFSFLNSSGNQYGLLLGEKTSHVEEKISDSQIHTSNINSLLCISSFIPWPKDEHVYNRGGKFNNDCLGKLLAMTEQDVVGWYSFRHNSTMRPSLRETTLHKNLISGGKFDAFAEDFFFFLCTSHSSSNLATFTSNYAFLRLSDGRFAELPVRILNLGDTTRKEYRKTSNATLSHCRTMSETFQSARGRFVHSTDEMDQSHRMNQLSSSVNKSLEAAHRKLLRSEGTLGLLETEVETLRNRLKRLEQEKMTRHLESTAEDMLQKERQINQTEEETAEKEEQAEMDKLLKDLGLESGAVLGSINTCSALSSSSCVMEGNGHLLKSQADLDEDSSQGNCYDDDEKNKIVQNDSCETNGMNGVKNATGQKTYSAAKPNRQEKSDPFDFLEKDLVHKKAELTKPTPWKSKMKNGEASHNVKQEASMLSYNSAFRENDSREKTISHKDLSGTSPQSSHSSLDDVGKEGGIPSPEESYAISSSPTF